MNECGEGVLDSGDVGGSEHVEADFDACAGLSFAELGERVESEPVEEAAEARQNPSGFAELDELVGQEIGEYERLMEDVNGNYDPFDLGSPYNVNCGSCAIACEMRLSGLDPEAVAEASNIGTVAEMNEATGKTQVPMAPSEIVAYAEQQGPGFHGVVGCDWKGTSDGHWVNVSVSPSGRVYALDGQCGQAMLFEEYVETYAKGGINWDLSR